MKLVFEALDYEAAIDHALVDHLGRTASKLGLSNDNTLRLHQALYFFRVKGYFSAVDILKEIGASNQTSGRIGKSEGLKKFLFASLFDTGS